MRQLLLLRHAKAVPGGSSDHDRALAPRGMKEAAAVGRAMVRQGWRPAVALVSDARRTRQTFEQLALGKGTAVRLDPRLYAAGPAAIIGAIREAPDMAAAVLVVGHNPGIAVTARTLVSTGDEADLARLRAAFPTSTLAVIRFDVESWTVIGEGAGHLEALRWSESASQGE